MTALNNGQPRKVILQRILDFFSGVAPFALVSRRVRLLNEMGTDQTPALFIQKGSESRMQTAEATPPYITLNVDIIIYQYFGPTQDQADGLMSDTMEDLLDKIDELLAPPPMVGRQTLGGIVSHCWVEGETLSVPGDLDGWGMLVVPIKVLIPS